MDVRKASQAPTRRSTFYDGPDSPHINRRSSTFAATKTIDTGQPIRGAKGPGDNALKNAEADQDYLGALVLWNSEISKLTKPQLDLFMQNHSSGSLEDYTETLQNAIGKREDSSKILWFAKKVKPVYDFVSNFVPVASAVSEFSPVPFSAVLGGITCILSISVKVDDYQAKMVESLDQMMFQLELLKDYKSEPLFQHDAKVEASQVHVTTDILKFCVTAAKALFNEKGKPHHGLLHLLKLQLKDFDTTFGSIETQFKRHLDELEDRRNFHGRRQLHQVHQVVNRIEKDNEGDRMDRMAATKRELDARERKAAEERRQRAENWLQFIRFTAIQDTTYCSRVDETGNWLLDNPEFQTWRQGVRPARLWVHGKAGSGKSFLAARVINDLQEHVKTEASEVSAIAYAYCSSTKLQVELTYNALLSSLLRQLYNQLPPDKEFNSLERRAGGESATRSELKEWIQAIIILLRSCFIIIDGLDECVFKEDDDFEDLCSFIASLTSTKDHTLGVKIIVFSRPNNVVISNAFSDFTKIPVDKGANDADMKLFISKKIDRINLKPSQDQRQGFAEIKDTIREQADGMFLWVDLRVKDFQHLFTVKKIKKALRTTSKGLDGLYQELMKSISEGARENAFKALLWLANSHRSLSKAELLEALALEDDSDCESTDDEFERLPENIPLCTLCADLLIEHEGHYQLIHASLKDFLLAQSSGIEEYNDMQRKAQSILARSCLTYLTFDPLRSTFVTTSKELLQLVADYPLLGYASQYWGDHFASAKNKGQNLDKLSNFFLGAPAAIDLSLKIFGFVEFFRCPPKDKVESSALHILSIFNLRDLARDSPSLKAFINDADDLGHLPIDYAMIYGSKEMVIWILGVYEELQDGLSGCLQKCRVHLLAHAAEKNWEDVVMLLVDMGFDKDLHTPRHPGTACYTATNSRAHGALKALLKLGADPNIGVTSDTNPLLSAAEAGDLEAVKLLLDANADPKVIDENGLNPLHHAARRDSQDSLEIARKLLDSGANVDAETTEENGSFTPLCEAAWSGSLMLAEVLLRNGANLEHVTRDAENPMIIALKRSHWGVLEMLIASGTDKTWVSAPTEGITLLHHAAFMGDLEPVQFLLMHNNDVTFVDGEDNNGNTPFFFSMEKKSIAASLALIENGATKDLKGWAEKLPAGFFTQLHKQYQVHARPGLHSPTLENLLFSLATEAPRRQPATSGKLDDISELLEDDGADVGRSASPTSSQSNIGQTILTELESIYNKLLHLDQQSIDARALRKKSWMFTDASYFSSSILDEDYDGAFIDRLTYDKITHIENEIYNMKDSSTSADGAPESGNSGLESADVPSSDLDGAGVENNHSINGDDSTQNMGDLHSPIEKDITSKETTSPQVGFEETPADVTTSLTDAKDRKAPAYNIEDHAPSEKKADMWTEIRRDVIVREAIEELKYDYEETEYFFYVMRYLKYVDVLELINVSDEMKSGKYWFDTRGSTLERHYLAERSGEEAVNELS